MIILSRSSLQEKKINFWQKNTTTIARRPVEQSTELKGCCSHFHRSSRSFDICWKPQNRNTRHILYGYLLASWRSQICSGCSLLLQRSPRSRKSVVATKGPFGIVFVSVWGKYKLYSLHFASQKHLKIPFESSLESYILSNCTDGKEQWTLSYSSESYHLVFLHVVKVVKVIIWFSCMLECGVDVMINTAIS